MEDFMAPHTYRLKIYIKKKKKRSPDDFSARDSLRNGGVRDMRVNNEQFCE